MESSREIVEESTFEFLMNEVLATELLPHLNMRDLVQLSRTTTGIHGLFAGTSYSRDALMDKLMPYLADIIVNEPSKEKIGILKKLLNDYPELLQRTIKKVVFEETEQAYINYSLLQLAFAEGDDDLCFDLQPCFESAMGSAEAAKEEIDKQLKEKFEFESDEEKKKAEEREQEIKNGLANLLTAAIQAITNEQFNNGRDREGKLILSQATLDAITLFRDTFDALQPREIKKGRRSRLNTLQETNEAYIQALQQWGYNYNRCALFEDGFLSHVLLNTAENDAERFNQGLFYLQKDYKPEPFERRRTLRNKDIKFQEQLRSVSSDFSALLGSCVDIVYDVGGRFGRVGTARRGAARGRVLSIFMSNKNKKHGELMQPAKKYHAVRSINY